MLFVTTRKRRTSAVGNEVNQTSISAHV